MHASFPYRKEMDFGELCIHDYKLEKITDS